MQTPQLFFTELFGPQHISGTRRVTYTSAVKWLAGLGHVLEPQRGPGSMVVPGEVLREAEVASTSAALTGLALTKSLVLPAQANLCHPGVGTL